MLLNISIQALGLIGFLLLLISYFQKDINKLLIVQVISGIFYAFHYFFLGAYSALLVLMIELVRDYSYYKTDLDKYIFACTIPFYIVFSYFTFDGIVSLLPQAASILDGYGLSIRKETALLGVIISSICWVIYDISCASYVGIVTDSLMILSSCVSLFKDRKQ